MKFVLAIQKKNKHDINGIRNHNKRLKPTKRQLPAEAWFTKAGRHEVVEWNEPAFNNAKSLSKRKDAVLAIEFVFQVGNQTEWRDMPTLGDRCGKPKKIVDGKAAKEVMEALCAGAKEAMEAEFGAHNIVSIDLHTDESSPHVHVVVTPVTAQGKLQAKKWLDGHDSVAALRARAHACVIKHIACTYTPGEKGGEPYDESMRAGGENGPQPAMNWRQRVASAVTLPKIITELRKQIEVFKKELKDIFQELKRAHKFIDNEAAGRKKDKTEAAAAAAIKAKETAEKLDELRRSKEDLERSSKLQITKLKSANDSLTSDNNELATTNNELKSAAQKRELRR